MRGGLLGSAVAASLVLAGSAMAQDARNDDITVTGQREVPPAEASHFVREVMTTVDGQFARFHQPVCPVVIGIPEQYGAVIAERVRHVAREAGVPVAKAKCAPNIIVILAGDADDLVKAMRKKMPALFSGLDLSDIRKAMREGPVHVWSDVRMQNEDGMGPGAGSPGGGTSTSNGNSEIANARSMIVRKASIIEASTQQVTARSVIVIDDDAAIGKTLTQMADYIAMRTLAGARPPKPGLKSDTILTLFEPEAVAPPTLTLIDASYLKGLYDTRPLGTGTSQASTIARTITKDSRERSGMRE